MTLVDDILALVDKERITVTVVLILGCKENGLGKLQPTAAAEGDHLGMVTQPSGAVDNAAFVFQPAVRLEDASNNPLADAGHVITASIASGSGTLVGTLTATTESNGTATFVNLEIQGTGDHTINFDDSHGLTAVVSATFDVASAPSVATKVVIIQQPGSATEDAPFSVQPTVQLRDDGDNDISSSGVTVTASLATGAGTLGGTLTADTDAAGLATFVSIEHDTAETITIDFDAPALTGATSNAVIVAAAGSFLTPDLIDWDFGTGTFSDPGIGNFPGGTPRHTGSDSLGVGGSPALVSTYGPGRTDYSPAWATYTATNKVFVRIRFNLKDGDMGNTTSNVKFCPRFSNPNKGHFYISGAQNLGFGFEPEASTVAFALGLFLNGAPAWFISNVGSAYVYAENFAGDDIFHSLEIEYDRNAAGTKVEARFWFDGVPIVMPAGNAWANDGYEWSSGQWSGGTVDVTPSTLSATRTGSTSTNNIGLHEEHSGGMPGDDRRLVMDDVAVSTTRIGP